MNNKIFKDKKQNFNKLIFFKKTPTYSTRCPKSIISHYITGNKLYEIMKNNRIGGLRWDMNYSIISRYKIYKIPKRQNINHIIASYIRIKPKKTNNEIII